MLSERPFLGLKRVFLTKVSCPLSVPPIELPLSFLVPFSRAVWFRSISPRKGILT